MKPKQTTGNIDNVGRVRAFGKACAVSCQKIVAQISAVKEAIFDESREGLNSDERLLRMALNEAEAVAWQTTYPHLVFPDLAMEKIHAFIFWNARQQSVRRSMPALARAA